MRPCVRLCVRACVRAYANMYVRAYVCATLPCICIGAHVHARTRVYACVLAKSVRACMRVPRTRAYARARCSVRMHKHVLWHVNVHTQSFAR